MADETENQAADTEQPKEPDKGDSKDRKIAALIAEIKKRDDAAKAAAEAERTAKQDAERKRAEAKGEWEKARDILQGRIDELEQSLASKTREIESERIQTQLSAALEGAEKYFKQVRIAEYMATPDEERKPVDEYVAALREAEPDRFEAKRTAPKSAGFAGSPAAATTGSLEDRLKSTDPAVAKAARAEWLATHEVKAR